MLFLLDEWARSGGETGSLVKVKVRVWAVETTSWVMMEVSLCERAVDVGMRCDDALEVCEPRGSMNLYARVRTLLCNL